MDDKRANDETRDRINAAFDLLNIPVDRLDRRVHWVGILSMMAEVQGSRRDRAPSAFSPTTMVTIESELSSVASYAGKIAEKSGTGRLSRKDRERLSHVLLNLHGPTIDILADGRVVQWSGHPALLNIGYVRTQLPLDLLADNWEDRLGGEALQILANAVSAAIARARIQGTEISGVVPRVGRPAEPFSRVLGDALARAYLECTGTEPVISTATETNRVGRRAGTACGAFVDFAEAVRIAIGLKGASTYSLAAAHRLRGGRGRKK